MLTSMRVPHTGRAAASREGHPFGVVKSWERLTREHWNLETVVATCTETLGVSLKLHGSWIYKQNERKTKKHVFITKNNNDEKQACHSVDSNDPHNVLRSWN
uniref:Uncharacterized protein n=1 Tax=Aegilops tauschii subsp. strangulata TaxID=200361 RepID=A0A453T2Z0_AEGTS